MLLSSLLFIQCLAQPTLINDICKKNVGVEFSFCMASFTSDPKSQSATTQDELGELSLQHLMSKASALTSSLSTILKKNSNQDLQSCFELYTAAIPTSEAALNSYKVEDYTTANKKLFTALRNSVNCAKEFQGGNDLPLKRITNEFIKLTKISLSFVPVASPAISKPGRNPTVVTSLGVSRLGSKPTSGKSRLELVAIAVQNLISKAEKITSAISQLQKDKKTSPSAKDALEYCSTSYSSFVKHLTEGLKGFQAKQYDDLKATLDTLTLDAQYCVDEFSNHNLQFPLMKQHGEFTKLADAASEIKNVTHVISKASTLASRYSILVKKYPNQNLQDCSKISSKATSTLEGKLKSYMIKDYPTTNVRVSAAMEDSADCSEGFQGENKDPLQRMNSAFIKLAKISLSFVRAGSPAVLKPGPNHISVASLTILKPVSNPTNISVASKPVSRPTNISVTSLSKPTVASLSKPTNISVASLAISSLSPNPQT
ncbi:Pectinesterase inhibitor domain [Dillenia turbinata]|uniref:Pectinesterase inhibitor domain n=1 Tax=Dillenia turbinata TaxID=194707 RepID=A0AAN8ZRK0_9MAGN